MSLFRWRGLGRSAEDHPKPLPPLPPLPAGFSPPVMRMDPAPVDPQFDPCGAPPVAFRKSGEK